MTLCVSARSLSRSRRRYTGRCGGEVFAGLRSPKVNWGLRLFPVIAKQTHDWLICILDVSVLAATYRSNARVRYSRGPGLLGVRQNCWGSIRRQATRISSGEKANAPVNSRSHQGLNLNGQIAQICFVLGLAPPPPGRRSVHPPRGRTGGSGARRAIPTRGHSHSAPKMLDYQAKCLAKAQLGPRVHASRC